MDAERVLERLRHIEEAIAAVEGYVGGKELGSYQSDRMLRDAVERNLEKLSEASRHIPNSLRSRHPDIDWRGVADIGNVLRHAYSAIDPMEIWQVITADLPPLKAAVQAMIKTLEAP